MCLKARSVLFTLRHVAPVVTGGKIHDWRAARVANQRQQSGAVHVFCFVGLYVAVRPHSSQNSSVLLLR